MQIRTCSGASQGNFLVLFHQLATQRSVVLTWRVESHRRSGLRRSEYSRPKAPGVEVNGSSNRLILAKGRRPWTSISVLRTRLSLRFLELDAMSRIASPIVLAKSKVIVGKFVRSWIPERSLPVSLDPEFL